MASVVLRQVNRARGRRSQCATVTGRAPHCWSARHHALRYCRPAETSVCSVAGGLGFSSPSEAYLALAGFSALVPDWCRLPAPRALLATPWYWILLSACWAGVPPSCEPLYPPPLIFVLSIYSCPFTTSLLKVSFLVISSVLPARPGPPVHHR